MDASRKGGIYVQQHNNTTQYIDTINNLYYEDSVGASNVTDVKGTPLTIENMRKQTFVDELNKNVESIILENIDVLLKNYKLSSWQLGSDGYPTLVNDLN